MIHQHPLIVIFVVVALIILAAVVMMCCFAISALADRQSDPAYACVLYKADGCSHVDGYLCDLPTCPIVAAEQARKAQGPHV